MRKFESELRVFLASETSASSASSLMPVLMTYKVNLRVIAALFNLDERKRLELTCQLRGLSAIKARTVFLLRRPLALVSLRYHSRLLAMPFSFSEAKSSSRNLEHTNPAERKIFSSKPPPSGSTRVELTLRIVLMRRSFKG